MSTWEVWVCWMRVGFLKVKDEVPLEVPDQRDVSGDDPNSESTVPLQN